MENKDIREEIAKAQVTYWRVAEQAGISGYTLSRWLRHPLVGEKRERVLKAIETLKKAENKEG